MIHLFKTCMITAFILGLTWSAPLTECVENVATTEIIKATEESNGHRVSLPLSVFDPQDYHPLLITVSGKNVN